MMEKWSMPDPTASKTERWQSLPEAARLLTKYGFYFSIAVFAYTVLFPFRIDISWHQLSTAWSKSIWIPYWYPKTGVRFLADDIANILLMMPLGFFGFLHCTRRNGKSAVYRWGALGLALGVSAEFIQLAIPTRATVITDIINNGLGSLLGAAAASAAGHRILLFFTGVARERRNIYLWLLIWSLVAMVGPINLGSNALTFFDSTVLTLQTDSLESGTLIGAEWLNLTGFALIGALAARLAVPGRRKPAAWQPLAAAALVLVFPVLLQYSRLLVGTCRPSLDDLILDIVGALLGFFAGLITPSILRARNGFLLFQTALVVAGLKPFLFSSHPPNGMFFQWIPFYEFCKDRTPIVFYETTVNFSSFAILGGFLQLSFPRSRSWQAAVYALVFSGAIEFIQMFLPNRTSGITDILMAVLGAWIGAYICAAVESERWKERQIG
jgi:glycopeptide antibiotics resistance protein